MPLLFIVSDCIGATQCRIGYTTEIQTHQKYEALIAHCRALHAVSVAVAHPCDAVPVRAAMAAARARLIVSVLATANRQPPLLDLRAMVLRDYSAGGSIGAGCVRAAG